MKVSELSGEILNLWTARADNADTIGIIGGKCWIFVKDGAVRYSPSTDWSQGGPIIERERYSFASVGTGAPDENGNEPVVCIGRNTKAMEGPTHLIAAMRCFVASRYGEEVPDE